MIYRNKNKKEDEADLEGLVYRYKNHIYFYDEVNPNTQLKLQLLIREACEEEISMSQENKQSQPICLHINSGGGWATCGFALYDFIKATSESVDIIGIVEGEAASAASLILLGCSTRLMSENSFILIHQISWGAWGNNRQMTDHSYNADKMMKKLINIYKDETTIGSNEKTEEDREKVIKSILEHDYQLDIEECIKYGLVEADEPEVELTEDDTKRIEEFVEKVINERQKKAEKETKAAKQVKKVEKQIKTTKK